MGNRQWNSAEAIADVLSKLAWSVKSTTWWRAYLDPDKLWKVALQEDLRDSDPDFTPLELFVEFRTTRKSLAVPLRKGEIFTKSKGMWFKDNVWRLTPQAVEKYAKDLEKAVEKTHSKMRANKSLTKTEIEALFLIEANAELTAKGHNLLNRSVDTLLSEGYIDYAPRRLIAYKLTRLGEDTLDSLDE